MGIVIFILLFTGIPVLLVVYAVFVAVSFLNRDNNKNTQAQAERMLQPVTLASTSPYLSYNGATATTVAQRIELAPRTGHIQLVHRISQNEHGEYFYLVSGTPAYIKHLSQAEATIAIQLWPKPARSRLLEKLLPSWARARGEI